MRNHMMLVERLLLVEHNVVNPTAIEQYIRPFVMRCQAPAGKAWLEKKLRPVIMNDAQYLNRLSADDLSLMPNLPDYVAQAAERGDAIYQFAPTGASLEAIRAFRQQIDHVVDWFNALARVATAKPSSQIEVEDKAVAEKWLEKLPKIPVGGITAIADNWFNQMGKRLAAEKAGVEIVYRWPNGFYAVRYTDLNTMMTDGRDLQNCLQRGMYWNYVQNGTGAVYAIRKPNDEAVIGIRVTLRRGGAPTLDECKGKNNKPAAPAYVPYVIDFMTAMGIDVGNNHDLKNAGIEVHDGRIGRFEDIADVTYDQDGIKIWQTKGRFVATTADSRFEGLIANQAIVSVASDADPEESTSDVSGLLRILNILALPPGGMLSRKLEDDGVFYHDGRYGDSRTVGKQVFKVGAYSGYEISLKTASDADYSVVMVFDGDTHIGRLTLSGDGKLSSVNDCNPLRASARAMDPEPAFVSMLNTMGHPPTFAAENILGNRFRVYFDGKRYGALADSAKPAITVGAVSLLQLGKRPVWLIHYKDGGIGGRLWITRRVLENDGRPPTNRQNTDDEAAAIRQLALKQKVSSVKDAETFAMLNTPSGLVADFASFLAVAAKTPNLAYVGVQGSNYHQHTMAENLLNVASHMFARQLTAEQQRQVYDTLKLPPGSFEHETTETDKIYDITVPHIHVRIPAANPLMVRFLVITDKKLIAAVEADMTRSLQAAGKQVDTLQYGYVSLGRMPYTGADRNTELSHALYDKTQKLRAETEQAIQLRRANPDKYATDLSSRFAAMNAFRKR